MDGEGVSISNVMQIDAGEKGLMIRVEGPTTDREIEDERSAADREYEEEGQVKERVANVYTISLPWDETNPTTLTDWQEAVQLPTSTIDTTH